VNDETFRLITLAGQGFYCSQILLLMGLEAQGKSNPDLIRAMAGLAGGLGFTGDTCGALTGGACLLGLYAGKGLPEEAEGEKLNLMISELVDWFTEEFGRLHGGIRCETILWDDPRNRSVKCPSLTIGTYEKVKALLVEYGFDLTGSK
jgi:C_GCAxxG_C_C family probable redox protein